MSTVGLCTGWSTNEATDRFFCRAFSQNVMKRKFSFSSLILLNLVKKVYPILYEKGN